MIDMTEFTRAVKRVAVQAVKETVPANAVFGTVVSPEPLQIAVGYEKPIYGELLILPSSFRKNTNTTTSGGNPSHTHTIEIDNSLKMGDKVALLKMQGGQRHIVLGVV